MTIRKSLLSAIVLGCVSFGLGGCSQSSEQGPAASGGASQDVATLIAGPLIKADGSEAPADALKDKTVLVYFSAHWCPPCRGFTPVLVQAYDAWKAAGKPVELVFVSSDKNEAAMRKYMSEMRMNWLAVPYSDRSRADRLSQKWKVDGIPTLVVVSPTGETLTTDGRSTVGRKGRDAIDDWVKP